MRKARYTEEQIALALRQAAPQWPSKPAPKEFALHLAVADHLRAFGHSDWRWSHYPAGEKRDPRAAAKLKAKGLQRGWPDFLLIAPCPAAEAQG